MVRHSRRPQDIIVLEQSLRGATVRRASLKAEVGRTSPYFLFFFLFLPLNHY
jgi:hypothetical protein